MPHRVVPSPAGDAGLAEAVWDGIWTMLGAERWAKLSRAEVPGCTAPPFEQPRPKARARRQIAASRSPRRADAAEIEEVRRRAVEIIIQRLAGIKRSKALLKGG